jgi:hypothetical protein
MEATVANSQEQVKAMDLEAYPGVTEAIVELQKVYNRDELGH